MMRIHEYACVHGVWHLNLLAVQCIAGEHAQRLPLTVGLRDDDYRHDGQLTKRDVRAVTLARLAPNMASTWALQSRIRRFSLSTRPTRST